MATPAASRLRRRRLTLRAAGRCRVACREGSPNAAGLWMSDLKPKIDPRRGDIEDDASSSKRRSLLSLAGSLLAEISLPKLAVAWIWLIVVPSLMLGVAPIVASIWLSKV